MITAIVNSLGQKSLSYHDLILPIIHDSVQPGSEAIVYLLEEALELWSAILQQTPSENVSPNLLALSSSLLPLLDMGSELLRQIFEIIESYTILSPTTILAPMFLEPFLNSMKFLLAMLSSSRARDAAHGPHVLEYLISTIAIGSENYAGFDTQQALNHLLTTMISTGYLGSVLSIVRDAYEYHQDPRANRRPPEIIGPGESSLFTLLSRMVVLSPDVFIQAASATNIISGTTPTPQWLLTEWLAQIDSIGDVLRKKLQVLALTNLLTATTSPFPQLALENLQSYLTIWTDICVELGEEAAEDSRGDYLWHNKPGDVPEWPDATPEDGRKRTISNKDPIYTVNVRHFIAEKLRELMERVGGAEAFEREWLTRIDSVVLQAFVDLKIL
jgi:hypothetical protein